MSTLTHSSSAPWSFTGELDFVSDEEHNVWNELMIVLAHHECSPWLQRCLRDGEMRKLASSSHFALDLLTVCEVRVAKVRRRNGTRSSGGQSSSEGSGRNEKATG